MPRTADHIFLKLATQRGFLAAEDAEDIVAELERLEGEGTPSKARLLCLELGFIDDGAARALKQEVRVQLERKEREVTVDSRNERRIAGFELLERLGSGAMGVVFKARHLGLNKTVALKLLNPDFAEDERYVARFLQEARVAAALNHPNIVQAYDVGQAGDVHYIAMECVDGKTVKELIERRGHLDEQAAVEIVLQVLDALKHAHSRSLIHRDIKPANIMITRDGQAKVLDLGLARRTDIESGLTGEGRAIGTPYFMAPEQALDKGADYRADIYSLGATFYNMVTGEKPYVAGTPVAVMNMHLKAPIPDAHQANPKISEGLAKIIKKMLAKRPADRYQDHDALMRDLEAVLEGLMPELDGGRPPEGVDFISRAQGASPTPVRSRPQRAAAGARPPGLLLVGGAAAACLLLGLGLLAHAGGGKPPPVDDRPFEGPVSTGPSEREKAAQSLLSEVQRAPVAADDAQASRAQADQLMGVAERFPETDAGARARDEARRLLARLENDERQRLDQRRGELDALVAQGKLREALVGWQQLVRALEDTYLKAEADVQRAAVQQKIHDRLEELRREAERLADGERERDAAAALRRALPLLAEDRRGDLLARIDELEGKALAREAVARVRTEREDASQQAEDERRLDRVAGQLIELVESGKVRDAARLAEEVAGGVGPGARPRAALHAEALARIVGLEELGARAFEKLEVGSDVSLERRQGRRVEGKVARHEGGRLTVAISSKAEVLVDAAELSDDELLRLIRRAFGAAHPPYLHGVAALKLYRNDADADAALARAADAGVDLVEHHAAALAPGARHLHGEPRRGQPVVQGDARPTGPDPRAEEERRRREAEAERARYERERKIYDARHRLFPESEETGFMGGQAILHYNYFQGNRNFAGQDWKRLRGNSYPTPPGQVERYGLVLEGRDGRAELTIPVEGNFEVLLEFTSQLFGKDSRLAITADTDGQHVETALGQLLHQRRGRRQVAGEGQGSNVRPRTRHTLELIRDGNQFFSKFDNAVVGTVSVDEFGKTTLGIEWGNAALNLVQIRMKVTPETKWVEKKLE
ncbi:MAG: protein kinase [Planctomycetes bacterium]|nr:protein kinase [Planctomycetota bacterium]